MRREVTGNRDLCVNDWWRDLPNFCYVVDIDLVLFCSRCKEPLGLVETARDVGQAYKATTITRRVAERAGLPAYCLLYQQNEAGEMEGEVRFQRVTPDPRPASGGFETLTLEELKEALVGLYRRCEGCGDSGP